MALGHNSKAVHRAYAEQAKVTLPPLEDYEKLRRSGKVIPFEGRPKRQRQKQIQVVSG